MRIERVEVTGFGCLAQVDLQFEPQRTHLILARNESGKSTLLGAIETALYGFPPRNRAEGRELRQRYRPWTGGASRIALELGDGTHQYRVEYDLLDAAGEAVERLTVLRDRVDVTDAMRQEAEWPGEWLLRLGRDDFRRSVLVRQGEIELVAQDTERLVSHLDEIVSSTAAGASASGAQERLTAALEDYRALAGLDRWSESHLERAKQWPRVEAKLREQIDTYEQQRQQLMHRRSELAGEIDALQADEARLAELRKARGCLQVLEHAVQQRDVQRQLDEDDALGTQEAALEQKIDALAAVRTFPVDKTDELTRLLEREAQFRQQMDGAAGEIERIERELAEVETRRAPLAAVAALADRADELQAALAVFRQAVVDGLAAEQRYDEAVRALAEGGCPLERVQEARRCYLALTFDERNMVKGLERHELTFVQQRAETERAQRAAQEQVRAISARRRLRRQQGYGVGGAAVVVSVLGALLLAWGAGASGAVIALVSAGAGLLALAGGAWLVLSAKQLEAYHYDQLQDEIEQTHEAERQLEREKCQMLARIEELAGHHGLTSDALRAAVQFYLLHRDQLDIFERFDALREQARQDLASHQRRWAEWWRTVDAERADDTISVEAAEALVEQVRQYTLLAEQRGHLESQRRQAQQNRKGLLRSVRETQEALATLLRRAGVALPLPDSPEQLTPPEELVVARREFAQRAESYAELQRLLARHAALRERRLKPEDRTLLESRRTRLAADARTADEPATALDWLRVEFDADTDLAFDDWRFDGLVGEDVARARTRVHQQIEEMQAAQGSTWHEARGFLKDYTRWMQELEGGLRRLRAELQRGVTFADAVDVARQTLASVGLNSYERWSGRLTQRLQPLLGELLPGYELESIGPDLTPRIVHTPTGQQLDLAAITLHLSRGAKDRLFLALRLALAQVLGDERGVRLPLLLDDPLANWDDEALAAGLGTLAKCGQDASSLIIFTCQRSRCEEAARTLDAADAGLVLREFHTREASMPKSRDAADIVAPTPPAERKPAKTRRKSRK